MDSGSLFAFLLVGLTAGTILYLFLIVLVIGHRHKTGVERLLFFVFLVIFLHQSGLLLYLNTLLQPLQSGGAAKFALTQAYVALLFLPAVLVHLHVQYFKTLGGQLPLTWPAATLVFYLLAGIWTVTEGRAIWVAGPVSAPAFGPHALLTASFAVAALFQWMFARCPNQVGRSGFHKVLCVFFVLAAVVLAVLTAGGRFDWQNDLAAALLVISPALPGAVMAYLILRRSFHLLGVQRNLAYAATGGFLAVLYLTLASRISMWLAPHFPPVATVSILVFVLVFLFEPLQRWLSRALRRLFHVEVEKVQGLMTAIHQQARGGHLPELLEFAERRIAEEFHLAGAAIQLPGQPRPFSGRAVAIPLARPHRGNQVRDRDSVETLWVTYEGAILSGETQATLETLASQLPGAIDLCSAIEEKLKLERELAERERFAMLGQMAASITHNLKNPLGSMKTLLQLQLENPELAPEMRRDCDLVVGEIDRMSAKLQQLLHFARPAVRSGAHAHQVDAIALTARTLDLIRRGASQRGIALLFEHPPGELLVPLPEDALTDIFQNITVNAVEATSRRGTVKVALERNGESLAFSVTDDGPGIPPDVQARIFQPFFTTKPAGTGLGLAIVQRRLSEIGGTIECSSPVANERGTRFLVTLPCEPS